MFAGGGWLPAWWDFMLLPVAARSVSKDTVALDTVNKIANEFPEILK